MIFEKESEFPSSFTINSDLSTAKISADLSQAVCSFGDKIILVDLVNRKVTSTTPAQGSINEVTLHESTVYGITNQDLLFSFAAGALKNYKLPEEGTALAVVGGFAYVGTKKGNLLKFDLGTGR